MIAFDPAKTCHIAVVRIVKLLRGIVATSDDRGAVEAIAAEIQRAARGSPRVAGEIWATR
jgi:hypothetical protein